jgi:hypothetical protein
MTTPDATFLSFTHDYLTSSYTVRRLVDTDGVSRIYIGIRQVPTIQLQHLHEPKPTVVFKLEQNVANQIWQLMSGSISGSF